MIKIKAKKIKLKHGINMDNVHAQAYHHFKEGYKFWFDQKEIREINVSNEDFAVRTMEEEILAKHFKPAARDQATHILTTTEIAEYL